MQLTSECFVRFVLVENIVFECPSPKQSLFVLLLRWGQLKRLFVWLLYFCFHSLHKFANFNKTICFHSSWLLQATMGEPNTQQDIFLSPKKPERLSLPGTSSESSTPASTIPQVQKVPSMPVSWLTQANKKTPQDYKKDRAEKYAQYFQGNQILPIPELVEAVQPKTLSLIITDIKTRRLAGLKKRQIRRTFKSSRNPLDTSEDAALLPGMSCCHHKNWHQS